MRSVQLDLQSSNFLELSGRYTVRKSKTYDVDEGTFREIGEHNSEGQLHGKGVSIFINKYGYFFQMGYFSCGSLTTGNCVRI